MGSKVKSFSKLFTAMAVAGGVMIAGAGIAQAAPAPVDPLTVIDQIGAKAPGVLDADAVTVDRQVVARTVAAA